MFTLPSGATWLGSMVFRHSRIVDRHVHLGRPRGRCLYIHAVSVLFGVLFSLMMCPTNLSFRARIILGMLGILPKSCLTFSFLILSSFTLSIFICRI